MGQPSRLAAASELRVAQEHDRHQRHSRPVLGDGSALTDLIAGHIPMMFGEPTPILPLWRAARSARSPSRRHATVDRARDSNSRQQDLPVSIWCRRRRSSRPPARRRKSSTGCTPNSIRSRIAGHQGELARTGRITVDYPPFRELGGHALRDRSARQDGGTAGIARTQ